MTTILDIHKYKQEILNHIKKVFPDSKEYSNEVESWVEVVHNGTTCGVRYTWEVANYLEWGIGSDILANTMLDRLTRKIVKGVE